MFRRPLGCHRKFSTNICSSRCLAFVIPEIIHEEMFWISFILVASKVLLRFQSSFFTIILFIHFFLLLLSLLSVLQSNCPTNTEKNNTNNNNIQSKCYNFGTIIVQLKYNKFLFTHLPHTEFSLMASIELLLAIEQNIRIF